MTTTLSKTATNGAAKATANPLGNVSVMLVTPDMAAAWLARGGLNRTMVQQRVRTYAEAMKAGDWRLTYEAIKLDSQGLVRDGQHRLAAIVLSKQATPMLVVHGVDEDAFDVMDTGRARTVGDVLGIRGFLHERMLSGTVRFLIYWERDHSRGPYMGANRLTVAAPESMRYLRAHPDVENWLPHALRMRSVGLRGGDSLWGGLLTVFGRLSHDHTMQFVEGVVSGADLKSGDPRLVLRNQLLTVDSVRLSATKSSAWIIRAWNAYRRGDTAAVFRWNPDERFPEPA